MIIIHYHHGIIYLTTGRARFYNQKWSYANSHQLGGKSLGSFFDLHKGWNFLLSLKRISNEDVGRKLILLKSVATIGSWLRICLDYHTYAFKDLQYGTWRFPWRRQSGTDLKLYFSYVNTNYHSPYHSLASKRKTNLNQDNFDPMHSNFCLFFPLGDAKQCFKSNELTSISFVFRWT